MKNNKGFTLIELIMVTIILGIMAAVAVPRLIGTIESSEESAEQAVITELRAAVEQFAQEQYVANGRYEYPKNPFDLVEVDGSVGDHDVSDIQGVLNYMVSDGAWMIDTWQPDISYLFHRRRGNQIYMWTYSHDDWCNGSGCDSDDRGLNIGDPHSVPWGPDPDGNFYGCPPEDGGPPPNLGPAGDDGTLPEGTCFSDEHNGTLITDENMLSNNF